jgi:hypothetical protein
VDPEAEKRRLQRAKWPVVKTTLDRERDDIVAAGTPSERVAMVHRLTLDAWAMAGLPMPSYRRAEAPGQIVRPVR